MPSSTDGWSAEIRPCRKGQGANLRRYRRTMTPPEEPDPDLLAAHQEGQATIGAGDKK
jgi:hypothetical protein